MNQGFKSCEPCLQEHPTIILLSEQTGRSGCGPRAMWDATAPPQLSRARGLGLSSHMETGSAAGGKCRGGMGKRKKFPISYNFTEERDASLNEKQQY